MFSVNLAKQVLLVVSVTSVPHANAILPPPSRQTC